MNLRQSRPTKGKPRSASEWASCSSGGKIHGIRLDPVDQLAKDPRIGLLFLPFSKC